MPINVNTPDVETNSATTFEVNDTRKDKIEQIILTSLDLTVTSPIGEDFSFLKSIALYISAEGLPEIEIASKDQINNTDAILNMETTGADLQEYIKKDQFDLRVNAVTDEIISTDYELNIHQIYFVDAKIVGK